MNWLLAAFLAAAATLVACAGSSASGRASKAAEPEIGSGVPASSLYLQLVDGLHVTGTPVTVDPETFRLKVTGLVNRELSLSLADVRAMAPVREEFSLECPGFFVDHGVWTGVPLRDILDLAGLRPQAARVQFRSLSGDYTSVLSLKDAVQDGVQVSYEFDGRPFPVIHGYPLRVAAKGQPGGTWVKWLGEIRVLD